LAKLGSDLKKPDGLFIINKDNLRLVLSSIKLTDFCGIGEQIQKKLNYMGIFTVSDLAKTPLPILKQEFGIYGENLKNMANGIDPSPTIPTFSTPPPKSYSHSFTLPSDTFDRGVVKKVLFRLSEKVGRRMRADKFGGKVIYIYLRFSDFSGFSRQKRLSYFLIDGKEIYKEALSLFPEKVNKYTRMVCVGISELFLQEHLTMPLFPEENRNRKIISAMDFINDKFGDFTIGRASYFNLMPWEKTTAGIRTRLKFFPH